MSQCNEKSPPQTPDAPTKGLLIHGLNHKALSTVADPLTPPSTPRRSTSSEHRSPNLLVCPFDVDFSLDESGRRVEFGCGAWSNVYQATPSLSLALDRTGGLPTPPPFSKYPSLVAVKSPSQGPSRAILHHEARILTYLHGWSTSSRYLTPFYGFIPSTSSLVMSAVPLTLSTHLTNLASHPLPNLSPTEPILGTLTWLALSLHLITAIDWLRTTTQTIHGDIKPHNILLQPSTPNSISIPNFPYHPLFVDFSSSHSPLLPPSPSPSTTPGPLSALTAEYTAPELLTSAVLSNPASLPTPASDVFSLGVTLLSAATGNVGVYSGPAYVKNAKASQGWGVVGFARCEGGGVRVGEREGPVERVVGVAVKKVGEGRVKTSEWLGLVEMMLGEEKERDKERGEKRRGDERVG